MLLYSLCRSVTAGFGLDAGGHGLIAGGDCDDDGLTTMVLSWLVLVVISSLRDITAPKKNSCSNTIVRIGRLTV